MRMLFLSLPFLFCFLQMNLVEANVMGLHVSFLKSTLFQLELWNFFFSLRFSSLSLTHTQILTHSLSLCVSLTLFFSLSHHKHSLTLFSHTFQIKPFYLKINLERVEGKDWLEADTPGVDLSPLRALVFKSASLFFSLTHAFSHSLSHTHISSFIWKIKMRLFTSAL